MRRAASAAIWAALLLAGLSHAAAQVPPPQPPGGLQLNAPSNASPLLVPRRLVGFGRTHFYQIPGAEKEKKREKEILLRPACSRHLSRVPPHTPAAILSLTAPAAAPPSVPIFAKASMYHLCLLEK